MKEKITSVLVNGQLPRQTMIEILCKINNEFPDEEKEAMRKQYERDDNNSTITDEYHRLITGIALNTVQRLMQHGGTADEVHRALKYFLICFNAKKYNLDFKQAGQDLDIESLREKYLVKRKIKQDI